MIKSVFETTGQCKIQNNSADTGGALNTYDSILNFRGTTKFHQNEANITGGGISAVSSTLQFFSLSSSVTFSNNLASLGGAMYLDQASNLYIMKEMMESPCNNWYCISDTEDWMVFTFVNNTASKQGGALYINDTGSIKCTSKPYERDPIYKECFMQTIAVYERANDWDPTGVNFANVYFINNTAPEGEGPLLYGGLLDRCAIDTYAEQLQFLNAIPTPQSYITMLTRNSSFALNEVASDAVRICFCEDDRTVNCSKKHADIPVKRGEQFNVTLAVVNQMNTLIKGEVMAYLSPTNTSSRLAEGQSQQSIDELCTDLQYTVFSAQPKTLNLYAAGPCNNNGISRAGVLIDIDPDCPVGFSLSESSLECECDPKISNFVINCSIETGAVQRQGNFWISSIYDNTTTRFIIHNCPYDYCRPSTEIVSIDLNNFENGSNAQCAFNRVGLLCGSCEEGYSLTLGSSRCQKCTNLWLLLVIPFILVGMALVFIMMACNFTLASGTLNGLLFYANILIANQSTFFPFQKVNVLTVFVSWLGLNLGIPTCFFNGMDGFQKVWIQMSFEAYLILLMIIIILLGRFVRVANFYHKHKLYPVHALATISMLSYEKLNRKIFSLIAFATLEFRDGTKYATVWLFDPTQEYFKEEHILLMIMGVCIIIAGVIFNFILIFNKTLVARCTSVYFEQFMQAFSAPFKSNHLYWVGLLLLLRNISYLTSEILNASQYPKYSLHVIFSAVVGILLLKFFYMGTPKLSLASLFTWRRCETPPSNTNDNSATSSNYHEYSYERSDNRHTPSSERDTKSEEGVVYKNPYLDLLETSFLINLSVLTYFTLYLEDESGNSQDILFYISSSVVLLSFLGILTFHIYAYTNICTIIKIMFRKPRRYTRSKILGLSRYGSTSRSMPHPTHSEV